VRVLNVNMSLDPVFGGGTAERAFKIGRFLSKHGIECDILSVVTRLTHDHLKALSGVKIIKIKCLSERFYIPNFQIRDINAAVANADIIHLMNHWTIINALIYIAARKMGKPYVVCPAGALPITGRSKFVKRFYNHLIGKRIIADADAHIAISGNEIVQYENYGIGSSEITIIPNGIDPLDYNAPNVSNFRRKFGLGSHPFILFVGRLNRIKGPDLLLHAYAKLEQAYRKFHLVYAGPDGGMLSELINKVKKLKLEDRVHFTGYLGGIEKSSAYHAARLLVIPSRQEAMSIVALEAGVTGTPVLLTDRCGFDAVADIGGGMVVNATVAGIKRGLEYLLKEKTSDLTKWGQNLKRFTLDNYTWDVVIDSYIELFHLVVHRERK